VSGLDFRPEGYRHQELWDMVYAGPGSRGNAPVEQRMQQIIDGLRDSADVVNTLVRNSAGDVWTGAASDAATEVMSALRDYGDVANQAGNESRNSALGQSGISGFARDSMPPVVAVPAMAPPTTNNHREIFAQTQDYMKQEELGREAERRARELMGRYAENSAYRVDGLPEIPSAPQFVIQAAEPSAPMAGDESRSFRWVEPRRVGGGPDQGFDSQGYEHGSGGQEHRSTVVNGPGVYDNAVSPGLGLDGGRPPGSAPGAVSGFQDTTTVSGAGPVTTALPPAGNSGASPPPSAHPGSNVPLGGGGLPLAGGLGGARSDARGARSGFGGGEQGGRGGQPGASGRSGPLPGDGVSRAGESGTRGGGRAAAMSGMPMGGGAMRREEDEEHKRRYGVSSDELFDENLDERGILRTEGDGFFVAPGVIGGDEA